MTVYGNFEAVKQIFKTHHGSIWSARTKDTDDAADCCIKLLELNEAMIEKRDTSVAQHLLVAAALQQAMGNKSELWAPVYGLGSQGTNAFYVTWLFPRSAQSLIDNRVDLTAAEIKTILLAVVDGLIDLKTAFHRSHGNLKPSNVLITDRSRIRDREILLSDPDPSAEDVPSLTRTPDSKAIGELLYALVTHKPSVTARYPLPKSDKWNKIGSTGKQWFALCETLVNTVNRRGLPSLEQIRERITLINPTRRRAPGTVAAVVLVAAALGAGYLERDKLPSLYAQGSTKLMKALHSTGRPSGTTTRPVSPQYPASQPPVLVHAPAVVPVKVTPVVSNTPAVKTTPPPPPVASLVPRTEPAPAPPPIAVPVKPVAPVIPQADVEGKKAVQETEPPEFHSAKARMEFIGRRDQFAARYFDSNTSQKLVEWSKIMASVNTLDADYPAVDASVVTTGWPAGLAGVISARRDASLVRAIDQSFDQRASDPTPYQNTIKQVQTAVTAAAAAHDAMALGNIDVSQKQIAQCNAALKQFPPADSYLVDLFDPMVRQFAALDAVANGNDRAVLLETADNESAVLAVRLAAWLRAGTLSSTQWPSDLPSLVADGVRARRLNTLLQEAGSIDIARQVNAIEDARWTNFYASLKDETSLLAVIPQARNPQFADTVAKAPVWFRYDLALYTLKTTLPAQVTDDQKKAYNDLAGQVNAPGVQLVHDVLQTAQTTTILPLGQSGPGSTREWKLRAGSRRDRCTYVSPSGQTSLEFLRVHVPDDPQGIDCYLCTTETPVSLLQDLLNNIPTAFAAAEALNKTPPVKAGMRVWSFDDASTSIKLDDDDYSKCFVVGPKVDHPAQFVTPELAFYLARRVGCRLPTSREWLAALAAAKSSPDENMKGFATTGLKLRDQDYAKLLKNPSRDPAYWPDDNIFLGNLSPGSVQRGSDAQVWAAADLEKLGTDSSSFSATGPLTSLQASHGLGFRTVGDDQDFGGVFHDLIGNVAEFVMDAPVVLGENVAVAPPLATADVVARVNSWMSPTHLKTVSVIGGSAVSPPALNPTTPYPLPQGMSKFADVGFRLAFTDPACLPNAQREILGQANYLLAP